MSKKSKNQRRRRNAPILIGSVVSVISGKDKGNKGKVLAIDWERQRILVEKVNIVCRHLKEGPEQQGGITHSEATIHYSNVLLYNEDLDRGVRFKVQKDGNGNKQRICVKTSKALSY